MEYKIYHSPGQIISKNRYYLDQLSEKEKWIYMKNIKSYLLDNYNLTLEQYYGLVVMGNKDWTPVCPYCGNHGGHLISLYKGWASYCNQSHITKHRLERESALGINPFQNPDFIKENSKRNSEVQKERMKNGTSQLLNPETKMIASRENFKSRYGKYHGFLYLSKCDSDDSKFKLGITTNDYNSRQNCRMGYLYNHHKLLEADGDKLADIEFELKLKFCDGHSELIPLERLHEFLKEVRKYK